MPSFRTGTVTTILEQRDGLQRIEVDGRRAYVLTQLIGAVALGDRVVVNTTAVDLGLGTGGWDVVHWNLERDSWSEPGPGHIMKLRYTSLQVDTGAAEEDGPTVPLAGTPVVACALHSQVPCVAAVVRRLAPSARIAYLMLDGGALPLALSDLVPALKDSGLLSTTVTCGHAFGGDYESVNLWSGIEVAASQAGADVVVASIGPGAVGTGDALGHSGMQLVDLLNATSGLQGVGVAAVRYSDADPRDRHRGASWHNAVLRHAAVPPVIPIPRGAAPQRWLEGLDLTEVDVPEVGELLAGHGLRVTTMGRSPEEDPGFFQWAGAAGVAAAERIVGSRA